jgi:hypothetical protein
MVKCGRLLDGSFRIAEHTVGTQEFAGYALAFGLFDNECMAAEILPGITDDNDFIKLLNSMVGRLLIQESPEQL